MPLPPPVTSAMRPSSRTAGEPIGAAPGVASRVVDQVPIIGGTGALGFGLALRWARAGVPVVIGSRDAERAPRRPAGCASASPTRRSRASRTRTRPAAGRSSSSPSRSAAQSENLTNLKEVLEPGQILVDATVPLAAAVSGKATRLLGVPAGVGRPAGAGDGRRTA